MADYTAILTEIKGALDNIAGKLQTLNEKEQARNDKLDTLNDKLTTLNEKEQARNDKIDTHNNTLSFIKDYTALCADNLYVIIRVIEEQNDWMRYAHDIGQSTLKATMPADTFASIKTEQNSISRPADSPNPPIGIVATITYPTNTTTVIQAGQSISFTGTATSPTVFQPLTLLWNFDGGATDRNGSATGPVVFNTAGTYNISFRASTGASSGDYDNTPSTVYRTIIVEPL
jgi:hypothetical protein